MKIVLKGKESGGLIEITDNSSYKTEEPSTIRLNGGKFGDVTLKTVTDGISVGVEISVPGKSEMQELCMALLLMGENQLRRD